MHKMNITSGEQISYAFKHINNMNSIFDDFVSNMLNRKEDLINALREKVKLMIAEGQKDDMIYDVIKSFINEHQKKEEDREGIREILKKDRTVSMLPSKFKPKKYLDFGTGEQMVGEVIASHYGLDANSAFGVDVIDIKNTKNMSFMKYSGDVRDKDMLSFLQLDKGKFDLITSFMVLHHIQNIGPVPEFLFNSMNNGGYLIIKEHDANNKDIIVAIDIEHTIFDMMVDGESPKDYHNGNTMIKGHTGDYKSRKQWDDMFEKVGFKKVNIMTDPTYTRVNSFRTRHYHSIYYKP